MVPVMILGVLVLAYLGVALVVARMCSINSRWEDLIDRIPNPRIPGGRVKASLLPRASEMLEEEGQVAR